VQEAVELLVVYNARDYFSDPWNLLQTSGSVMVLISLVMQDIYHDEWGVARPCLAWAALVLWMTTLQFFEQFQATGPFISLIFTMLADTATFAVIMCVIAGSFGVGLFILFVDDMDRVGPASTYAGGHELDSLPWPYEFSTLVTTMHTMFRVHFGDFTFDFAGAKHHTAAFLMFGVFLGLVLIVMMNLLIAILSTEHGKVEGQVVKLFNFKRAKLLLTLKKQFASHHMPPPFNLLQGFRFVGENYSRRVAWICWLIVAVPILTVVKNCAYTMAAVLLAFQPMRLKEAFETRKRGNDELGEVQMPFPLSCIDLNSPAYRLQVPLLMLPFLLGSVIFYTAKSLMSALLMVRENDLFLAIYTLKRSFCQDRLRTNIGKSQKQTVFSGSQDSVLAKPLPV
jgi:hypothetical protein